MKKLIVIFVSILLVNCEKSFEPYLRTDKMNTFIIFIITFLILVSCKTSYEPANHNLPYGTWVYSGYSDSLSIYYSASEFEEDKPGFAIKENNEFIERTSGWCGTPPLSYYNIDGKWKFINQNTLKIKTSNWINEDYLRLMEIVSITNNELKVIFRFQQN